jgi:hypothetical protein
MLMQSFVRIGVSGVLATIVLFASIPAQATDCRWKVIFVKYTVLDDGGERRVETSVSVTANGDTVQHPNRGTKRLSEGETEDVNEEVARFTVSGRQSFTVTVHARESASGVISNETVTLSCRRGTPYGTNRPKTVDLGKSGWEYSIRLMLERV